MNPPTQNPGLDAESVQHFFEEARAASQMRHSNIVDIFSFGTLDSGRYFYFMDLLDGAPLELPMPGHERDLSAGARSRFCL